MCGEREARTGDPIWWGRRARKTKPCYEVMVCGCLTSLGVGNISAVDGNINANKYQQILDANLRPVLARHFPTGNYVFQDDNAPVHRARSRLLTQNWHKNNELASTEPLHQHY